MQVLGVISTLTSTDTFKVPRAFKLSANFLASSARIVSISLRCRSISFRLVSSNRRLASSSFSLRDVSALRLASSFSFRAESSDRSSRRLLTMALRICRALRSDSAAFTNAKNLTFCSSSESSEAVGGSMICKDACNDDAIFPSLVRTSSEVDGCIAFSLIAVGIEVESSAETKASSINVMLPSAWSTRMLSSPLRAQPITYASTCSASNAPSRPASLTGLKSPSKLDILIVEYT